MQIIRIENTGPVELVIPHRGDKYVIQPGGSKVIPYDAAASLFGDPRHKDTDKDPARRRCYEHIRAMFNFYIGWDAESVWEDTKMPRFDAYDLETGDQIYFVVHDPFGQKTYNAAQPLGGSTDQAILAATIADMERRIVALTNTLATYEKASSAPEVVAADPDKSAEPESLPRPKSDDKVTKDSPRAVATRA